MYRQVLSFVELEILFVFILNSIAEYTYYKVSNILQSK